MDEKIRNLIIIARNTENLEEKSKTIQLAMYLTKYRIDVEFNESYSKDSPTMNDYAENIMEFDEEDKEKQLTKSNSNELIKTTEERDNIRRNDILNKVKATRKKLDDAFLEKIINNPNASIRGI